MSYNEAIPVVNVAGESNGCGMFGGDGWWAIIIFALIFGWGRGGYGSGDSGGASGAAASYVLASDFSNIERKIDGVNNGLCDGFYAVNTGMLNGFANVTQAVTSGFYSSELSRCNQQAALMQQLNSMQRATDGCCCDLKEAIQGINYNLATQACDTRNLIQNVARDITDNQNAGTREILGFLTNSRIRELESENQSLKLAASQDRQNAYFGGLINSQTAQILGTLGNGNCGLC